VASMASARQGVSGRFVAIDLIDRSVRAVEVNAAADGLEVTGLAAGTLPAPLSEMSADEAGRALAQVLRDGRIGAKQALLTIPRGLAVLKPLSLPHLEGEELVSAILLQAERELPFPPGEAHIDCIPTGMTAASPTGVPAEESGGVGVLLGAVQRGVIETYRSLAAEAGLSLRGLGLRPCATANALLFTGADTAGQFVALVDIGDTVTEISIVRDRHLVFSRSVTIGAGPDVTRSADPTTEDERPVVPEEPREGTDEAVGLTLFHRWQGGLILEVRRSLEAFAVQPGGGPVSALYLTGVGAADEALAGAIAEALATRVAVLDPFERLDLSSRVKRQGEAGLAAFASALGAAVADCRPQVPGFDFLTPIQERLRKPRSKRPIAVAAAAVALLAVVIGVPLVVFSARWATLARLEAEIGELEPRALAVRKTQQRIRDLAPWTDARQRVAWHQVYESLAALWPEGRRAYLTSLSFQSARHRGRSERGPRVVLNGRAQNVGVVDALAEALRRSKQFAVPDFSSQRVTKDKLGYPILFKITVEWQGAAKTTTRSAS